MANVWAIKSGDWSDTTVWNTGALPTSADDVYANNFNVNVNQNITVNSLRNISNTGIVAGGIFVLNTANVIIDVSNSIYPNDNQTFCNITATSGNIKLNIPNGSIFTNSNSSQDMFVISGNCNFEITAISFTIGTHPYNYRIVFKKNGNGNLTINGNLNGSSNGTAGNSIISAINTGNIIVNGDVTGGNSAANNPAIVINGSNNLTINGNVIGGVGSLGTQGVIFFNSTGNCLIVGSVTARASKAVVCTMGNMIITGIISGGTVSGVVGLEVMGSGSLSHIGTAQASAYGSAITCSTPTTSIITCTGPFLKNGYIVAIASQTLRINFGSNSYFQFKKSNGEDIDYVSTIEGYNYPTPADVRYGVEYKSGLAIGTCYVPNPEDVRKNIPVDNTVGTSENVNAEDILQAIQNSSLPIAERLRNVATVESTGAQLEAYQ